MTPEAERAAILRRIELRKAMGRSIPHKLVARLEQATRKALSQDVALKSVEREIAAIVRKDVESGRGAR